MEENRYICAMVGTYRRGQPKLLISTMLCYKTWLLQTAFLQSNHAAKFLTSLVHREIGSRGRPGFKSRRSQTLNIGNFETLEVTAMYFTFLETSSLFLYGQERSRIQLQVQTVFSMSNHAVTLLTSLVQIEKDWRFPKM